MCIRDRATVSRDIRELGLVKVSGGNGRYRYVSVADASTSAHVHGRFETIFRASVVHVDYAGNIISVKCHSGMANAACELFDARTWENVVGTLAAVSYTHLDVYKRQRPHWCKAGLPVSGR